MAIDRQAVLDEYTELAVQKKRVSDADMTRLRSAVAKALDTPYKAVALDIDGTLTPREQVELDSTVADRVQGFVERGIPVALITGRGRGGATSFLREWAAELEHLARPLPHIWVYAHHAGFRARASDVLADGQDAFLPLEGAVCLTPDDGDTLRALAANEAVAVTLEPYSARCTGTVPDSLDVAASNMGLRRIEGQYGGEAVIEYSRLSKLDAIVDFGAEVGVDSAHVVRVGDMGNEGGADFELLDHPAGFSTDRVSSSVDRCFPIPGPGGSVATLRLLGDLRILPPLSKRVSGDQSLALEELHEFHRVARERSAEEWQRISAHLQLAESRLVEQARPKHEPFVVDLFDPRSGGIRVRDEEVSQATEAYHALVAFFGLTHFARQGEDACSMKRAMYTDGGLLLRGDEYYRRSKVAKGLSVRAAFGEADVALRELSDAMAAVPKPRSRTELKLALAGWDYARQAALTVLTCELYAGGGDEHEGLTAPTPGLCRAWESVVALATVFVDFCLEPMLGWRSWHEMLARAVSTTSTLVSDVIDTASPDKLEISDVYRWREADWPLESLAAMKLCLEDLLDHGEPQQGPIVWVGLAAGGIELPAIASALARRRRIDSVEALARVSVYGDMRTGDKVRERGPSYFDDIQHNYSLISLDDQQRFSGLQAAILDDNVTTGLSLEVARDLCVLAGAEVVTAGVVRYPGPGRWNQMCMEDHGMLDPQYYFSFVRGLVRSSPYTRVTRKHPDHSKYEDELGNFDKAKDRIDRLIQKNEPIETE